MTSCTVAHQVPLSMGFSRQEYWRGLPCPSPGDLPSPGTEPRSPKLQADSWLSEPPGEAPRDTHTHHFSYYSLCCAVCSDVSHIRLFATPWTVAHQPPLSLGFSWQECWSGILFPPPEHLSYPGIEPPSLMSPTLVSRFLTTSATWKPPEIFLSTLGVEPGPPRGKSGIRTATSRGGGHTIV